MLYLVGIKKDQFEDRASGKVIEYGQLYTLDKRKNVRGYAVQVHKVSSKILDELADFEPGIYVELHYDAFQKVVYIEQVAPDEDDVAPDLLF